MPLVRVNHGGGCCGITHLHSFANWSGFNTFNKEEFIQEGLDLVLQRYRPGNGFCDCNQCQRGYQNAARAAGLTLEQWLERNAEEYKEKSKGWKTAVECVLAGNQYPVWKDALIACGFTEVFTFKNSNSNNVCHVFYGMTNPKTEDENVKSYPKDATVEA